MALFTIGHSTRALGELIELLRANGITRLVDVRRFPGSRRYPQFGRDAIAAGLRQEGIAYEHVEALGGRRATSEASPNKAWRNASFRGYADYMSTAEFQAALDALLQTVAAENVVVMCAEAVPWRCHRNLIADAAVARGLTVRHITGPGAPSEHVLGRHARVRQDGRVVYPLEADAQTELLVRESSEEHG